MFCSIFSNHLFFCILTHAPQHSIRDGGVAKQCFGRSGHFIQFLVFFFNFKLTTSCQPEPHGGLGENNFLSRSRCIIQSWKKCLEIDPIPISMVWRVGKHEFPYTYGHLIQFVTQNVFSKLTLSPPPWQGVGEHEFCVQIWIFYSIPSKKYICKLTSYTPPHPKRGGLGIRDFFHAYLICHSIPSKMMFLEINTTPLHPKGWGMVNIIFLCRSGHSSQFQAKNIHWSLHPHPYESDRVINFLWRFEYFYSISSKKFYQIDPHLPTCTQWGLAVRKHDYSADLDISFNPSKENLIFKLTLSIAHSMGVKDW